MFDQRRRFEKPSTVTMWVVNLYRYLYFILWDFFDSLVCNKLSLTNAIYNPTELANFSWWNCVVLFHWISQLQSSQTPCFRHGNANNTGLRAPITCLSCKQWRESWSLAFTLAVELIPWSLVIRRNQVPVLGVLFRTFVLSCPKMVPVPSTPETYIFLQLARVKRLDNNQVRE